MTIAPCSSTPGIGSRRYHASLVATERRALPTASLPRPAHSSDSGSLATDRGRGRAFHRGEVPQQHRHHHRDPDERADELGRHHQQGGGGADPALPRPHLDQKVIRQRRGQERDAEHAADERERELLPREAGGHEQHRRGEHEDERHQRLAEPQAKGGVARLERIGARHARRRIGGERHRRRDVREHAVVEDEEVRDQRLDAEQHERRRGDGDHDDVVRGRRDAATHQHADQRGHEQCGEQRQRLRLDQPGRQDGQRRRRERLRRGGDDERKLEAHAGQRDDADHDADRGGRGADRQRVFGAGLERLDEILLGDPRFRRDGVGARAQTTAASRGTRRRCARRTCR